MKLPAAISSDITTFAAGKKRGFCRLRITPELTTAISADITPSAAGKKRGFCRLPSASGAPRRHEKRPPTT
ncbi:MAG: hypothetical protein WAN26_03005, partial [Steroidobacteraceae bacterium]